MPVDSVLCLLVYEKYSLHRTSESDGRKGGIMDWLPGCFREQSYTVQSLLLSVFGR